MPSPPVGHFMRITEQHTGQRGTVVQVIGWYRPIPVSAVPPWPICVSPKFPDPVVLNPAWLKPTKAPK